MHIQELSKLLEVFPRVRLARLPTPLSAMPQLGASLSLKKLYIKRDDETGIGLGGNKLRKLEFLLGEALQQGADTVLTAGAMQSNHARQTAAACAKLGLKCELILRCPPVASDNYRTNGNVLLDRLFGATIHVIHPEESREAHMQTRAEVLRQEGRQVYCIPVGGSCGIGNLGYVDAAMELELQLRALASEEAIVFVATGSGGTYGGLACGVHLLNSRTKVFGIAVESTRAEQEELAYQQACDTARVLKQDLPSRTAIRVFDEYAGPGYGKPTAEMRDALRLTASLEGLVLDPVYTGKVMAGLIDLARRGELSPNASIVFLHTGGAPGVFAYADDLLKYL